MKATTMMKLHRTTTTTTTTSSSSLFFAAGERRLCFYHHHRRGGGGGASGSGNSTTTTAAARAPGRGGGGDGGQPSKRKPPPVPDTEALPFQSSSPFPSAEESARFANNGGHGTERSSSSSSFNAKSVRLVQWYPGHIARAERLLRDQLKNVDCVVEVRDLRIPLATSHPDVASWIGRGSGNENNSNPASSSSSSSSSAGKLHITVLNRSDMVDEQERARWVSYFKHKMKERHVVVTDAKSGRGVEQVKKIALSIAKEVNEKRIQKGLLARPVRTAVVGYPNVGKSALINRLVGKKACASAPRPGVTRDLRWVRVSEEIDLLDSPGVLPPRMSDQDAANRLAMANDIGEASYKASEVAARLFEEMKMLPSWTREKGNIGSVLMKRYKMSSREVEEMNGDMFIEKIAMSTCGGDFERAGTKVLNDFRGGFLGRFCLEVTPAR
jgi:ribosome biogenesis GTPase A